MIIPVVFIFLGTLCLNFSLNLFKENSILLLGIACYFVSGGTLLLFGLLNIVNVYTILLTCLPIFFRIGYVTPVFSYNGIKEIKSNLGLVGALQGCIKVGVAAIIGVFTARLQENSLIPMAMVISILAILILTNYVWIYVFNAKPLKKI